MQTPSPDNSPQPQQRREPLRWMAAAALLLAFLSICCIAQAVTFLLAPRNQRSNLDLRSKLLADYRLWDINLSLPGIGQEVPNAQAADIATATSVALLGTATPVIVGAAPTAELAIVPPVANAPTPTLPGVGGVGTVPPAPTATPPVIAGGGSTRTPTNAATSTPTESDATAVATTRTTIAATPTNTRESQNSTKTPTNVPPTIPATDKPDATTPPTKEPTKEPTTAPPNDTPRPTTAQPTNPPPPPATDTPKPTVKPTDKPSKTATPTVAPTATATRAPTATATRAPTATATRAPTPTNTPAPTPTNTPAPTPTDTPTPTPTNTPAPTPTDTPVPTPTPTVGIIDISKAPSADPTTNGAPFRYTITITNRTGAPLDVTSIQDTADLPFTVNNCGSPQGGACIPPIGPGLPSNWTGPVTLPNNGSMQLFIDGSFNGVTSGSQVCNTRFTVTTSAGSPPPFDSTACVTVN